MKKELQILIFLFATALIMNLGAIEPDIRCSRYSLEQGLSQSIVESIMQDKLGFMWFATEDGLNRFDGYSFRVLRQIPGNSNSPSQNNIDCLMQEESGLIWIGTFSGGLDTYDPTTGKFQHFFHDANNPRSLSSNFIRTIIQDRQGVIWVGTHDNGLNRFDREKNSFTVYRHDNTNPNSISHDAVYALLEDRAGTLWVGTKGGGLNVFDRDRQTFSAFRPLAGNKKTLSHDEIQALAEDINGDIWIGTFGGGLNRLENKTRTFNVYRHNAADVASLSNDQINTLFVDRQGRLWIGTNGGGLNLFLPKTNSFVSYTNDPLNPQSLSFNEIKSIREDRSGMIWVGTYGGGINKFNGLPKPFVHYRSIANTPNGLSHNIVWSIYQDANNILWIGTHGGGLDKFDRKNNLWTHYRNRPGDPSSLSNDRVRVIKQDRYGIFWIGTNGGGLNRFDPVREIFHPYRYDANDQQSLSHDEIRALCQDRFGKIWVGTHGGGLNEFDPRTGLFVRYRYDAHDLNSLSCDIVRDIIEDRQGNLWIATDGGGLELYDRPKGRFIHHQSDPKNPSGLQSNFIFSLYEDPAGTIWLGTWGGGLVEFQPRNGVFRHFTTTDGLPSDSIYGILQDESGNLWLSTTNGLCKFDPIAHACKNFSEWDGLQSNEFNGGAKFKSVKNEMFFGGINGFNAFSPAQIKDNPLPPPLVITSIRKLNREITFQKPVNEIKELRLSRRDYLFSFQFSALDFTIPANNKYAYRMAEFDPNWIFTNAGERMATYTNLPPGRYTFMVKGTNNDGIWSNGATEIAIRIDPAYWQTWWFKTSLLLFLLGIAYLIYKRHLENLRLKTEMNTAHDAQMSIMPQQDPQLEGLQISAVCIPAHEIGGDFFDYFWWDDENSRFGIVVADVSGKAMKAAMTALLTSGMIYANINETHSVKEFSTRLNRSLCQRIEKKMFTSLCLVAIDLRTKELVFVNAGLNDLILKRGQALEILQRQGPTLPLGVSRESSFDEKKKQLEKGDIVLLTTDGLTDIQNTNGEFFDMKGLMRVFEHLDTRDLSAMEIKKKLIAAAIEFAGGQRPSDDITLAVIKIVD